MATSDVASAFRSLKVPDSASRPSAKATMLSAKGRNCTWCVTNSLVLPHVLRFNEEEAQKDYVRIALNLDLVPLSEALIRECEHLAKRTGLPTRMSEVGVTAGDLPRMASGEIRAAFAITEPGADCAGGT